jgi:hypothetical protein
MPVSFRAKKEWTVIQQQEFAFPLGQILSVGLGPPLGLCQRGATQQVALIAVIDLPAFDQVSEPPPPAPEGLLFVCRLTVWGGRIFHLRFSLIMMLSLTHQPPYSTRPLASTNGDDAQKRPKICAHHSENGSQNHNTK